MKFDPQPRLTIFFYYYYYLRKLEKSYMGQNTKNWWALQQQIQNKNTIQKIQPNRQIVRKCAKK
jgi:hypothetical protein